MFLSIHIKLRSYLKVACKIKKKWTYNQGKENYVQLTADFGSLQMRLCTVDTFINPSTFGTGDKGLFDIYRSDSACPDAHSSTAKTVFVDSINGKMIDVEMEDGSVQHIYQNFGVKVNRNGKEILIEAADLKEGDDIIEATTEPIGKEN